MAYYRKKESVKGEPRGKGDLQGQTKVKVAALVEKQLRGPPRSVYASMQCARKVVRGENMSTTYDDAGPWMCYRGGPRAKKKYATLPITEMIPAQRGQQYPPNDQYRGFDTVFIKGVSLRLVLQYAQPVRLMVFAFHNGARRELPLELRPFKGVDEVDGTPSRYEFETLTKTRLLGGRKDSPRHVDWHGGPFKVREVAGGKDWFSSDGTAFRSRMDRQSEGYPVGDIKCRLNGRKEKSIGKACSLKFNSGNMRTSQPGGPHVLVPWTGSHHQEVDLYVRLNKMERHQRSTDSRRSVNERPLELFIGFDCPLGGTKEGVEAGVITGLTMEVFYN